MFMKQYYRRLASKLPTAGTFLTALCAVHCLAMPMLPVMGGAFAAGVMNNPWLEFLLLPLAYGFAGYALYKSYRLHLRKLPVQLYMAGVAMGITGLIFHLHLLMALSALPVIAAQYANYRFNQVCCAH